MRVRAAGPGLTGVKNVKTTPQQARGEESMADIHIHKFVTWGWWGRELGVWTVICSRKHINFLHRHDWGRIDFMSAIEESFKTRVSPRLIKEQIVTVTDASRDF